MQRHARNTALSVGLCSVLALTVPTILSINGARAEQPPSPCHPNPNASKDRAAVASRGDVVNLPGELKDRLAQLANRPHTYLPLQVFAEADGASQLFQYYLLDTTGFEPNVFTAIIPGVYGGNVQLTATGGNCGLPTVGAVRVVLEPKPGLPTDPNDPRDFNDVFTDISPLFVINNESGWYEGWMIHDITVPSVAPPRADGHAQFGTIINRDAEILKRMGTGNNVPGNIFTVDGRDPHFPSASDHFPDLQRTSCLFRRAWGLTMPSSNQTSTLIGSSTIWGRTGFIRFMSCPSRVASRIISDNLPRRLRKAKSESGSRSSLARDRGV